MKEGLQDEQGLQVGGSLLVWLPALPMLCLPHVCPGPPVDRHIPGAEAAAAAAVTDGDKKGHRPRPTEVVVPPYATAQDAVPPKSGRPEAATAPHKVPPSLPRACTLSTLACLNARNAGKEKG